MKIESVLIWLSATNVGYNMSVFGHSFHHLVLFVCHLFIDGQFRTIHIVYDPGAHSFRTELISDIQSLCSDPIPLFITDVTKQYSTPWTPCEHTDNILQLIFFDPEHIHDDNELSVFYHLFLFPSTTKPTIIHFNYSSLALHYTSESISVHGHWIPDHQDDMDDKVGKCPSVSIQSIYDNGNSDEFSQQNLFDLIFGEWERQWLVIAQNKPEASTDSNIEIGIEYDIEIGKPVLGNFYFSELIKTVTGQ